MPEEEPKIIIDEDWKARVEREREEAEKAAQKSGEESDEAPPEQDADPAFISLVTGLATQTMFMLGMMPDPESNEVTVDLVQAKHLVDALMMLREKTKRNLTPTEEGQLTEMVSELQRLYVLRAQQTQESALRNSGIQPEGPGAK